MLGVKAECGVKGGKEAPGVCRIVLGVKGRHALGLTYLPTVGV